MNSGMFILFKYRNFKGITRNVFLVSALVVLLWLLFSTIFYANKVGWSWETAYFYTIDSGLSIGYGNVSEPNEDSVHIYTIFNILFCSSIISGSISVVILYITEFDSSMLTVQRYTRVASTWQQASSSGSVTEMWRYLWYLFKYWNGWYVNPSRTIICWAWGVWIVLGALWWINTIPGNQTFITGVYFAVATCSTAGLIAPPCTNGIQFYDTPDCEFSIAHKLFIGTYAIIGVPLHTVTWGLFGTLCLDYAIRYRTTKKLWKPISTAQYNYFASSMISSSDMDGLTKGEFALLELWRLGKVSAEDVASVLKKFDIVDVQKAGKLSRDNLIAAKLMNDAQSTNSVTYSVEVLPHTRAIDNWADGNVQIQITDSVASEKDSSTTINALHSQSA